MSLAAITVVSHDAGGAEILSSWLLRNPVPYRLVLEGPAVKIFARKLGSVAPVPLEEALEGASSMLCGTSWQSDLEWRALGLARASHIHSVAFLDHWENYRERFERAGGAHLPDEIWVADVYASKIALHIFGRIPVRIMGNPYLEDILTEIVTRQPLAVAPREGRVILFICEPVREHALMQHGNEHHWGYVEEDVLEYFLRNVNAVAADIARIVVRPHPSEPPEKYLWAAGKTTIPVEFSSSRTLVEDLALADIVVGTESMALVVALLAKKRVVSAIPPGGRACVLPQEGIEILRDRVPVAGAP